MKIKRDQVAGAVLVILGIIVFVMTNQLSVPFTLSYPGPKALAPGYSWRVVRKSWKMRSHS